MCTLLESKMEDLSLRKKTEVFIGTIHIQKEPVFSSMHKIVENIPYTEFATATMNFLKNYDKILEKDSTMISITNKGWLTFNYRKRNFKTDKNILKNEEICVDFYILC